MFYVRLWVLQALGESLVGMSKCRGVPNNVVPESVPSRQALVDNFFLGEREGRRGDSSPTDVFFFCLQQNVAAR